MFFVFVLNFDKYGASNVAMVVQICENMDMLVQNMALYEILLLDLNFFFFFFF